MEIFHLADREPVALAIEAAARCATLDELYTAIRKYKGHEIAEREHYTPCWPPKRPMSDPGGPLMIVSEKPEPNDTAEGRPFTGAYGSIMREVLDWHGVDLDQMHVSYACHWAPGAERAPNATQLSASRPFLFREIELVRPCAILAQGRAVLESLFMYRDPITPLLGMTLAWKRGALNIPALVTWHPAYAQRFITQIGEFSGQLETFFERFGMPDGSPYRGQQKIAA